MVIKHANFKLGCSIPVTEIIDFPLAFYINCNMNSCTHPDSNDWLRRSHKTQQVGVPLRILCSYCDSSYHAWSSCRVPSKVLKLAVATAVLRYNRPDLRSRSGGIWMCSNTLFHRGGVTFKYNTLTHNKNDKNHTHSHKIYTNSYNLYQNDWSPLVWSVPERTAISNNDTGCTGNNINGSTDARLYFLAICDYWTVTTSHTNCTWYPQPWDPCRNLATRHLVGNYMVTTWAATRYSITCSHYIRIKVAQMHCFVAGQSSHHIVTALLWLSDYMSKSAAYVMLNANHSPFIIP